MSIKYISTEKTIFRSRLPLVIGYFGSLHVMHNQILDYYYDYNILTFKDFQPKDQNQLFGFEERIKRLQAYDPVKIYVYDIKKGNITADEFIQNILMRIQPTEILVGSDFTFGSDKKPWTYLRKHFKVKTITYNPQVSTSLIAELLRKHKVKEANNFLMQPYSYTSEWISGHARGRDLGRRTINLRLKQPLLIPDGVYVSTIKIGRKVRKALTFVGVAKTFNASKPSLETHVIDGFIMPRALQPFWNRNNVKISFLHYLRPVEKFAGSKKLIEQIDNDVALANKFFDSNN